jgi:hypothetical protein
MVTGAGETRSEMRGEGDRERVPCWRSRDRQIDTRTDEHGNLINGTSTHSSSQVEQVSNAS